MNADKRHLETCRGCGAPVPTGAGQPHPYLGASAGCWDIYTKVLCREYGEYHYPDAHRLTVDAYSVQHVGEPSQPTIRSTTLHLVGLCMVLEIGVPHENVTRAIGRVRDCSVPLYWLVPPDPPAAVTIMDVLDARTLLEHTAAVQNWARAVWQSWERHHAHIHEISAALGYSTSRRT